jgi:hypothetical protein
MVGQAALTKTLATSEFFAYSWLRSLWSERHRKEVAEYERARDEWIQQQKRLVEECEEKMEILEQLMS